MIDRGIPPKNRRADMLQVSALAVLCATLVLTGTACRTDILGPSAPTQGATVSVPSIPPATIGAGETPPAPEAVVPAITNLQTDVRRGMLYIRGNLRPRSRSYAPFYGPASAGGWSLQVMIDTDPRNPGYWLGYDYIVRGVEWSPLSRTFVTREITLDPDTPGGWGPASGTATFAQPGRAFEIAIPLDAIGGIEGSANFVVETYATVPCAGCEGGLTNEFVDDYFGTIGDVREHLASGDRADRPQGLAARVAPLPGHDASASPRLFTRVIAER